MSDTDVARAADAVGRLVRGRHLLLLLDFDGTLCEFQADPAAVSLSNSRREVLLGLRSTGSITLGIVSGRRLDDVRRRTGLGEATYYAGLHGLEIEGGGERFAHPEVAATSALVRRLRDELQERLAGERGVLIEDKALSVTVHYREASAEAAAWVLAVAQRLAQPALDAGRLRIMRGACMVEFLPNIAWDKGSAARWIAERVSARNGDTSTVYVGDDVTDEDAFRAVRGRGLAIAASERASGADFRLDGPGEVEDLLRAVKEQLARSG